MSPVRGWNVSRELMKYQISYTRCNDTYSKVFGILQLGCSDQVNPVPRLGEELVREVWWLFRQEPDDAVNLNYNKMIIKVTYTLYDDIYLHIEAIMLVHFFILNGTHHKSPMRALPIERTSRPNQPARLFQHSPLAP